MSISVRKRIKEKREWRERKKRHKFSRETYNNLITTLTNLIKCEAIYNNNMHANFFIIFNHSRNSEDCKEEQLFKELK